MTHLKQLIAIALATALFAAVPAAAAEKLVAVITTGKLDRYQQAHASFEKLLRSAGMSADKVQFFVQAPNPDPMSWNNSLRKAVGIDSDLIISYGAPVTKIAKNKAGKIPVLFADVYDPVTLGIVKSLNITGATISGVSSKTPIEGLVAAFTAIKPVKTVGILYTSYEEGSALQADELKKFAKKYGFTTTAVDIKGKMTPEKGLAEIGSVDAIYLTESVKVGMNIDAVMADCRNKKIPVFSQIPGVAEKGAIVSLEADPIEQGQLLGVHALQLLKGQNILSLPVRAPNKVSLNINQQTANTLGLKIPAGMLKKANRVIK